jgi:hypothetical protein
VLAPFVCGDAEGASVKARPDFGLANDYFQVTQRRFSVSVQYRVFFCSSVQLYWRLIYPLLKLITMHVACLHTVSLPSKSYMPAKLFLYKTNSLQQRNGYLENYSRTTNNRGSSFEEKKLICLQVGRQDNTRSCRYSIAGQGHLKSKQ